MKKIITDEQRARIIELSRQGYKNSQIATELNMKDATLYYWKKKLRNSGIEILALLGRPTKKTNSMMKIEDQ